MNRRHFLTALGGIGVTAVGGAGTVFLIGGNDPAAAESDGTNNTRNDTQTVEDAPEAVAAAQPLAEAFHAHIHSYYDNVRVFITREGDIVMEYDTEATSGDELTTEFHQIAVEYADVVGDEYEPNTLSIVADGVQAIVPEPTVDAHVSGDINQEAYLETIEVTGVERPDRDDSE